MAFIDLAETIFTLAAIEVNLILIIVGAYLLIIGVRKKMNNIIFLALAFLMVGLSIFALVAFSLTFAQITIPTYLGIALYGPFTYLTFHKGKDGKGKQMMILIGLFFIIKAYFGIFEEISYFYFVMNQLSTILITATASGWYGYSAMDAYQKLKKQDINVDYYLRRRLKVMGYVSYVYAAGVTIARILTIVFNTNTQSGTDIAGAMISLLVAFYLSVFAIGMLLTWIMPTWFKNYLNKGYNVKKEENEQTEEVIIKEEISRVEPSHNIEKDIIEEQNVAEQKIIDDTYQKEIEQIVKLGLEISKSFDMITYLGNLLSKRINKNIVVSKGLIRVSINDEYSTAPKYLRIDEWVNVIRVHLTAKLKRINVDNSEDITKELLKELINNQALITVTAV